MEAPGTRPPTSLLERLRADPVRAPEALAVAAVEGNGDAAARWLAEKAGRFAPAPDALAKMAIRKHQQWGRASGAVTGLGGFVAVLPDLAALAWVQARTVLFVAAAYGHDPHGPERAAELLVIQELYPTVEEARRALAGDGHPIALAYVDKRMSGDEQLVRVLLRVAGRKAATKVASRLIPGLASITGAVGNGRDVRRIGEAAMRFYGDPTRAPRALRK